MKRFTSFLVLFAIIAFADSASLFGQTAGRAAVSPSERAQKQTAYMTKSLGLDAAQSARIATINRDYAERSAAIRNGASADKSTQMRALGAEKEKSMREVLTPDQYQTWKARRAGMKRSVKGRPMGVKTQAAG